MEPWNSEKLTGLYWSYPVNFKTRTDVTLTESIIYENPWFDKIGHVSLYYVYWHKVFSYSIKMIILSHIETRKIFNIDHITG